MYSQNNEQQVIIDYFSKNTSGNGGRFIDIGAFDPFKFSNTRALYEKQFDSTVLLHPNLLSTFKNEINKSNSTQQNNPTLHESGTPFLLKTQVIDWLKKKHNIYVVINIEPNGLGVNYFSTTYNLKNPSWHKDGFVSRKYHTEHDCVNDAIESALELI